MSGEVSSNACLHIVELMESRGCPSERLTRDLPFDVDQLRRHGTLVDWPSFCTLLERVQAELGGGLEALEQFGEQHLPRAIVNRFPAVARTVSSLRDLRWLGTWLYGSSLFRNVACEFEDLSDTEVRQTLTISAPHADSPQYFHLVLGALRSASRFLGLPELRVKMKHSTGRAVYTIHVQRSATSLRSRIFDRLRFQRPALREMIDALTQQQQQALAAQGRLAEARERLKAEIVERERVEGQLRQAQKLDVVGRLAAGIAHDLRNQIAVITSFAETGMQRVEEGRSVLEDLTEIRHAADRAAELTSDMLAFGRTTVRKPVLLDFNDVITGMTDTLRRMVGNHVEISTRLAPEPVRVRIDRAQFEQVILNLALNARDAMPDGGTITLATDECRVVAPGSHATPELQPGEYVVMSVSDTGCGIDEHIRERMFEPFFTTKPIGSGTGLGLSIVSSIVLQNDGHTAVSSRPGAGLKLEIYLPRTRREPEERRGSLPPLRGAPEPDGPARRVVAPG